MTTRIREKISPCLHLKLDMKLLHPWAIVLCIVYDFDNITHVTTPPVVTADASSHSGVPSGQAEEGDFPGECVLKQGMQSAEDYSAKYVSAQMLETWQQLESLQNGYDKSMAELQNLKLNHEKLLGKLRDVHHELNEVCYFDDMSFQLYKSDFID